MKIKRERRKREDDNVKLRFGCLKKKEERYEPVGKLQLHLPLQLVDRKTVVLYKAAIRNKRYLKVYSRRAKSKRYMACKKIVS